MRLHKCGPCCPPGHKAGQATSDSSEKAADSRFTVDLHCHTLIPDVEALVADRPEKLAEPAMTLQAMGAESVEYNNRVMLPTAGPKLVDLSLRIAAMDKMGVDVQVISPSPTQYYYWADEDLASAHVRIQNEKIAEACAKHPERLLGLANIALQHPALAVKQLEYAVKTLGLKGIEVSTAVGARELSDPLFHPIWEKAEALGCIVFIHPFGTSLGERVNRYYLTNTIGQPLETTIALSSLIFSGTLDRYPGLKIVAAHGGGYLPYAIGRSNHAFQVRPEAQLCQHPPEDYLRKMWFDTVVYEPQNLRHLIDLYGVERLVVGTDYPFDMGDYDVHGLIDSITGLSAAEREKILGGNAAELLGLSVPKA